MFVIILISSFGRSKVHFATKTKLLKQFDALYGIYRYYHLIMSITNGVCSRIVFSAKVTALCMSIFSSYYVIRHSRSSSFLLSTFSGLLTFNSLAFYLLSARKLFRIPEAMQSCVTFAGAVLNMVSRKVNVYEIKLRKARIAAMPRVGISEGGFRYMDRMSTLIFIDFFINRVISLLLL